MGLTQTSVLTKVDTTLSLAPIGYGTQLYVLKYSGKEAIRDNPFNYAPPGFDDPLLAVGRGIVKPSAEVVSRYGGSTKKYDLLVLMSRLELIRRFPSAEENAWITENDRIQFRGNVYLISIAKPTGQMQDYCTMMALFCNTAKGQGLEKP